jgi:hypothetical protein
MISYARRHGATSGHDVVSFEVNADQRLSTELHFSSRSGTSRQQSRRSAGEDTSCSSNSLKPAPEFVVRIVPRRTGRHRSICCCRASRTVGQTGANEPPSVPSCSQAGRRRPGYAVGAHLAGEGFSAHVSLSHIGGMGVLQTGPICSPGSVYADYSGSIRIR